MKKRLKSLIKKLIKLCWDYTIEDDYRILSLKHTPIRIRCSITKKAWNAFGALPVAGNKLVFDNYMGRGYGCNTKYVTEVLLRRRSDLDIVWTVRQADLHRGEFPEGVRLVEYGSREALQEYYTAAVWVCNYHLNAYFNKGLEKRQGQAYIQMWHGSLGIKKIERDCDNLTSMKHWDYLARKNSNATDYWISNSTFESCIYERGFWNVHTILELGHPRNDIFFREDNSRLVEKVKHRLGISMEDKLVLYVPTFRESGEFPADILCVEDTLRELSKRFGGNFVFVVRRHPRMGTELRLYAAKAPAPVVDGSGYPDIQELLAASDVVITDYSSCIFDFLLTRRPGFIYAPDIERYNTERGFYYRLEEAPFPIAERREQLLDNISHFNQAEYEEKIELFLTKQGCMEYGNAAERVCDLIEDILNQKDD